MSVRTLCLLLCLPVVAWAQGFAGMGSDADGFALPDPDTRFVFPRDHGPHTDFRIEWWYATANLSDDEGTIYGIQWTLFRSALAPGGAQTDTIWMAHAAVSSSEGHFSTERFSRGDIGTAGVVAEPFEAWIDEWAMVGPSLSDVNVTAQGSDFGYELAFEADRPFVVQGVEGFSVKSEAGQASHYYSQPFYEVSGRLLLPSGEVEVSGLGWLDREWSSAPLTATQTGWDWASLHLDGGEKLMVYRLRDEDGSAYVTGTWIGADGTPEPIAPGEVEMRALVREEVEGRDVPVEWRIEVPSKGAAITIEAVYPDSWMDVSVDYWEGPVTATGTHPGRGYLEMTGY